MLSFFSCFSVLAFLPIAKVIASGGQIPVVDGVLGGVSSTARPKLKVASASTTPNTPGQLRVVENSGVCGEFIVDWAFIPLTLDSTSETTPGVYQASGYGDLTTSDSIW